MKEILNRIGKIVHDKSRMLEEGKCDCPHLPWEEQSEESRENMRMLVLMAITLFARSQVKTVTYVAGDLHHWQRNISKRCPNENTKPFILGNWNELDIEVKNKYCMVVEEAAREMELGLAV